MRFPREGVSDPLSFKSNVSVFTNMIMVSRVRAYSCMCGGGGVGASVYVSFLSPLLTSPLPFSAFQTTLGAHIRHGRPGCWRYL